MRYFPSLLVLPTEEWHAARYVASSVVTGGKPREGMSGAKAKQSEATHTQLSA